jgi:signal transduction histidine kinase
MKRRKPSTALVYVLGAYVIVQFMWWGYLMIDLTRSLHLQNDQVAKRVTMIIGEGSVFLLLLGLGLWRIQASIRKEMKLVKQQHNFMLSVTHELKTPVAATRLYLQTLLKHQLDEARRTEIMQKSLAETNRLEQLVEQILTASRLDEGKLVFHKEKIDLQTFLAELVEIHEQRSSFPIEIRIPDGITVSSDRMALSTVLNNIIENAGKYGSSDKGLLLIVQKSDQWVSVFVRDYGKGISVSDSRDIFRKFSRLENEETRSAKGTGLGLYIAHEFTKGLGGHLRLVEVPGPGACFEILLPL